MLLKVFVFLCTSYIERKRKREPAKGGGERWIKREGDTERDREGQREAERQRDRETERQRDRETERQRRKERKKENIYFFMHKLVTSTINCTYLQ
jgi:hypothetical protein